MATKTPVFIEVIHSAQYDNVKLCRKMMAELFKQKIAPLPFASSTAELKDVLAALQKRGTQPAIYVINTFWAEEVLPEIDPLLGEIPVLFLMRQIFGEPALAGAEPSKQNTLVAITRMARRPSCVVTYGSKTADAVVAKTATHLIQYLKGGPYKDLEDSASFSLRSSDAPQSISATASGSVLPSVPHGAKAVSSSPGIPASPSAAVPGVHGLIEHLGLATLLTMLDMEKKTGALQLTRDSETGRLLFRNGRVVYADVAGSNLPAESQQGAESVFYLLTWTAGKFDFTQQPIDAKDVVNAPTTSLLMEAARRMDEPVT